MTINEHVTEFAGKPVMDWDPETGVADPQGVIYRISLSWDDAGAGQRWTDRFAAFLDDPASSAIVGIVIGFWEPNLGNGVLPDVIVEALVTARDRLPNLRAIFLGDIIAEESEISWIHQPDVSPLLNAYPELEHFCVRGGNGLRLGRVQHTRLKSLVIQSGGLPGAVVREVGAAELPELEHLELWLGDEGYGGDATLEDLAPILAADRFPKLTYLGLRNSEHADEIAAAVAQSPVMEQIRILDLSLGTLSDTGAEALLQSASIKKLQKLDLHHHYCSEAMVERLEALGIEVDTSDRKGPDTDDGETWRYVAVSE